MALKVEQEKEKTMSTEEMIKAFADRERKLVDRLR